MPALGILNKQREEKTTGQAETRRAIRRRHEEQSGGDMMSNQAETRRAIRRRHEEQAAGKTPNKQSSKGKRVWKKITNRNRVFVNTQVFTAQSRTSWSCRQRALAYLPMTEVSFRLFTSPEPYRWTARLQNGWVTPPKGKLRRISGEVVALELRH